MALSVRLIFLRKENVFLIAEVRLNYNGKTGGDCEYGPLSLSESGEVGYCRGPRPLSAEAWFYLCF